MEKEDYLDADSSVPGQNWVCLSFVSPEKLLKQKNVFMMQKFLEHHCGEKGLDYNSLKTALDDFMYSRNDDFEKEFHELQEFRTTVRGFKVRGSYDSRGEANMRAQALRRKDVNFHVYVAQVGMWLPWDPEADNIEDQEYQEGELNTLVKKYKENEIKKDMHYAEQKQEKMKAVMIENEELRKKNEAQKDLEEEEAKSLAESSSVTNTEHKLVSDLPEELQSNNELANDASNETSDINSKPGHDWRWTEGKGSSQDDMTKEFKDKDPWMQSKVNN